ncbi:MAG: pilus assembly protein TadG-related protein, partial [Planctomycetota bacterium]|nr:pilus assembly protein TadG-related protein [Planctomycetota bacterium]
MKSHVAVPRPLECRSGTILVLTSVVLLTIVGMLGLVLDSGLMMAQYRQIQNAADAAALAAAQSLIDGKTETASKTVGVSFVTNYNALPGAT